MKACLSILATVLVLASTGLRAADEKSDDAPMFKVAPAKKTDSVTVQQEKAKVVFVVQSPSGIGSATIERTADTWPEAVIVKLQLKGLESFVASNGKTKLNAAISSNDGKPKARLWKDDKETELLDGNSPLWMNIHVLGADGKPAKELPLKNGSFEMTLPKALLEGNPKTITLKWIDFHR